MPDQLPRKSKTPGQEAFETLAFLWGGAAIRAVLKLLQCNVPIVHPLVREVVRRALSPYTFTVCYKEPLAT